ncbi:MAG TPA: NAD(P)H-binding protein [Actinomycetota bacterium]|nr:NAD(P)H-binding protein [Actinomycetota bacterium]
MILVTGATGHVGAELVVQLAARGEPVRGMTRRPAAVSFPAGVEAVYGDFDDPASIDAAFAGVDRAFVMSPQPPGSAEHPTHELSLVDAARRAGVGHLVKLSVYDGGAGDDVIGAWNREAEAAVVESGLDWTLLRPGRFMSNALQWAPMIRRGDTVNVPFAFRPAVPIDPADIAAVAVAALIGDGERNVAYRLSGPEVLTPADELRILAGALGRRLELVEPPVEAVRAGMVAAGMGEPMADAIIARALSDEPRPEVLPTIERLLHRPPATYARWARAHAGQFSPTSPSVPR